MDSKFIINLQGKQFVLHAGLLNEGHQQGLSSVKTELLQSPNADNPMAIVRAEVVTEKGAYTGIGDADPESVGPRMVKHIVRMAETRAINRALRFAVNIGMCSVDELGKEGDGDSPPTDSVRNKQLARIKTLEDMLVGLGVEHEDIVVEMLRVTKTNMPDKIPANKMVEWGKALAAWVETEKVKEKK